LTDASAGIEDYIISELYPLILYLNVKNVNASNLKLQGSEKRLQFIHRRSLSWN